MTESPGSRYQRVNPRRLHEDIVRQIAQQIIRGDFAAGSSLPTESELASRFGVSRTVIREAARILVSMGLVSVRQGSGMWVQDTESWDFLDPFIITTYLRLRRDYRLVDDLFESRRLIEVEVAALAAQRRTQDDLTILATHLEGMRSHERDHLIYGKFDVEFHKELYVAAKNLMLRRMAWVTIQVLDFGQMIYTATALHHEESHRGHETIFIAIRDKDAETAREAVMQHLDVAKDTFVHSLRELPVENTVAAIPSPNGTVTVMGHSLTR